MRRMQKKIIPLILCLALMLCGCAVKKTEASDKLNVVVTIFPEYDFVRAVAGNKVNLKLLIDPGTEVHSFDPAPSDIIAVENSDLFIMIGGESDEWARRLISGAEKSIRVLNMMDKVDLLYEDGEEEYDEHIWTSPSNAEKMVAAVCDALCELDNANADFYRANAESYISEIDGVRRSIMQVTDKAKHKYILVADRFPFKYLTNEFGIDYFAAFGGCASNTDISIKTMSRLIAESEKHGCEYAFYVEMSNRNIANALSEQTGISLLQLHSAHNVTLDDFKAGKTYVDIMKDNARALERGMS